MFAKEINTEVFLTNNFIANMLSYVTTAYKVWVSQSLIMKCPFFFFSLSCMSLFCFVFGLLEFWTQEDI